MFGAIVLDHLSHRLAGTTDSLPQRWPVRLRIHRKEQIFPKQVSRWSLSRLETRSGTTACATGCILVMPHPRVPDTVAADPVGRRCRSHTENKHFRPDIPQAARFAERQA